MRVLIRLLAAAGIVCALAPLAAFAQTGTPAPVPSSLVPVPRTDSPPLPRTDGPAAVVPAAKKFPIALVGGGAAAVAGLAGVGLMVRKGARSAAGGLARGHRDGRSTNDHPSCTARWEQGHRAASLARARSVEDLSPSLANAGRLWSEALSSLTEARVAFDAISPGVSSPEVSSDADDPDAVLRRILDGLGERLR